MSDANKFRPGNYRHYKGGIYTALGLVRHHETGAPMVLYLSHATGGLSVRPLKKMEILGGVDADAWDDWIEVDGVRVRRFAYVDADGIDIPSHSPPILPTVLHSGGCGLNLGGVCTCTLEKAR